MDLLLDGGNEGLGLEQDDVDVVVAASAVDADHPPVDLAAGNPDIRLRPCAAGEVSQTLQGRDRARLAAVSWVRGEGSTQGRAAPITRWGTCGSAQARRSVRFARGTVALAADGHPGLVAEWPPGCGVLFRRGGIQAGSRWIRGAARF